MGTISVFNEQVNFLFVGFPLREHVVNITTIHFNDCTLNV